MVGFNVLDSQLGQITLAGPLQADEWTKIDRVLGLGKKVYFWHSTE